MWGRLHTAASRCWAQALGHTSSVAVVHGLSCSETCGIFPDQGLNLGPLHWQADSYPQCHPGSPPGTFLVIITGEHHWTEMDGDQECYQHLTMFNQECYQHLNNVRNKECYQHLNDVQNKDLLPTKYQVCEDWEYWFVYNHQLVLTFIFLELFSPYYRLLILFVCLCSPKPHSEALMPTVMALGGAAFGRWLCHEGGELMNGISALLREAPERSQPLPPQADTRALWPGWRLSPDHTGTLISDF